MARCTHDPTGDGCRGYACFDWTVCRTHLKWYARQNLWSMVRARPIAEVSLPKADQPGDYALWFLADPAATEVRRFTRVDARGRVKHVGRRLNAVWSPIDRTTALVVADWYEAKGDHASAAKIRFWLAPAVRGSGEVAPLVQGELFT